MKIIITMKVVLVVVNESEYKLYLRYKNIKLNDWKHTKYYVFF